MSIQKIPYRDLLSFNRLYRDYHEKFYHDLLCLEMTFLQHNGHNFKIMIDHEAYHVQITLRKVMILRDMHMKTTMIKIANLYEKYHYTIPLWKLILSRQMIKEKMGKKTDILLYYDTLSLAFQLDL